MSRYVLTVDLKDDPQIVADYVEHHRHVWPEVLDSLRASGIDDMEILILDRRLVMIVETGGDLRTAFARHLSSSPSVRQWETLMKAMQESPPGGEAGEWWAVMEPIFRLNAAERCAI